MLKWFLGIAGVILLGCAGFVIFMNYRFGPEIAARISQRKSEMGYLAECVEEKTKALKRRPTKDEYITECLNPAPFLEEHNRVRSLDKADPSYQNLHYDYDRPPFHDSRIVSEHGMQPPDGFAILYWNGDSMDMYISWEKEKFFVR